MGCIPQPTTPAPPPGNPGQPNNGQSPEQESSCGITDIPACVNDAIDSFFRDLVTPALNDLLDLLANTLLTTPPPDQLPRLGELWDSSWQIMLACYAMLILIAGILVMAFHTLQTRTSIKEILPRVIIGFLAGALSLWASTQAVALANALARAIMSGGVDERSAADTLKPLVLGSLNGGFFIIFIGLFLAGMLVALLLTYIVRVALTIILIAGAPLALMFHALPQTEGIAFWWWKAFGGCLAIQLVQSLSLITAMRVFLAPGGFTFFGPTTNGVVNLLVALALMYILFKIPFWILGSLRGGGRRSFLGSLIRGFIAYKTFGLLKGGGGTAASAAASSGGKKAAAPLDPYTKSRTTSDGQYMLPLEGLKRGRASRTGPHRHAANAARTATAKPAGTQLKLPLDGEWPENKPRLGRDGQYRLPLDVQRQPKPASPPPPPSKPQPRDQQLRLPADGEWPENKPRLQRDGQYRLPFEVQRVPRSSPQPSPGPRARPPASRQTKLPADGQWPENRPRLGRDGQYRLPLNVQRTRKPTPPPAQQPPKRQPRGKQLPLPLDLPKIRPPGPSTGQGR
ncbi:hypothetical protein FHU38_000884 [Saccharomonospora amisosensis]|uniref:TrbL/VirB6 plasmid conjugal transfer protein n=1 Tax=Saccharomonospora amisosensis TaxID=1128677 RepID=A0A7X5ZPS0_9PSEU|nr:hypothetical protein [Saccharomonospora amisosensis]NIJ10540.1 hypothetical protein [Saccharomonospora amisosensis]